MWLLLLVQYAFAVEYDVIVYGATPGGIAAALKAVETGASKVALLEGSGNVGGMSAAGGIGLRDIGNEAYFNGTGREWAMLNAEHYGLAGPVWQPDMSVANTSFWKLLKAASPVLEVYLLEQGGVKKEGTKITDVATDSKDGVVWWQAKQFIDASYDGDIIIASKAAFTFGRESRSKYNEALAGRLPINNYAQFDVVVDASEPGGSNLLRYINPAASMVPEGEGDELLMAYSYRLCITNDPTKQVNFSAPNGYNAEDFLLLKRYLEALVTSGKYPKGPPFETLVSVFNYRNGPAHKYDLCDSGNSAVTSDCVTLNTGYPLASRADKAKIAQMHKYYLAGYLWFLTTDPSVPPNTRESTTRYGLCKDAWPDNGHWPQQLYIREGIRLIGDRVITQNDLVGGRCTNDSVGLATWGMDIHVVNRAVVVHANNTITPINEGETVYGGAHIPGPTGSYELSYALLLPRRSEVTNLLVPVCSSASHVAYSSVRVEPHFMVLGQAAGTAAVLANRYAVAVQDVPIQELQMHLRAQGTLLHWPGANCTGN